MGLRYSNFGLAAVNVKSLQQSLIEGSESNRGHHRHSSIILLDSCRKRKNWHPEKTDQKVYASHNLELGWCGVTFTDHEVSLPERPRDRDEHVPRIRD
jgi:hypothetical protein